MNVQNVRPIQYNPVSTFTYVVNSGAVGFVDTDCSANLGTDVNRVWAVAVVVAGAAQIVGARANGVAAVPIMTSGVTGFMLTKVSLTGHIDFYRGAANASYQVLGYFDGYA
jgi:hypothetical protein